MLIGTMNHPGRDLFAEITWIGEMGFDFIDLTLEPPLASARRIDVPRLRSALEEANLDVIGHTAYYLPLCSPFESIRGAAVEELRVCLDVFAEIGAEWMNLHPDREAPFYGHSFVIEQNLRSIRDLLPHAKTVGVGLMIENLPEGFNSQRQLAELLDPIPELGFHLDIGHANLMVTQNTTDELLAAYGHRLKHVHLHDNKGGNADLHLPLGSGNIDTRRFVRALQSHGYDRTITLEVFTSDKRYLTWSKDVLRRIWDESAQERLKGVSGPEKAFASS